MRSKLGLLLMGSGLLMLAAAGLLLLHNFREDASAGQASQQILEQLAEEPAAALPETRPVGDMTRRESDGHAYIGTLSLPALELELPVMADWDYPSLKIAPLPVQRLPADR